MGIAKLFDRLKSNHVKSKSPSLEHTRERVLFYLILVSSIIGMTAYIPSFIGSLKLGYYDTLVFNTLFYLWVLFLLLCKRLSFKQRAIGFIVPIWLLSFYLIVRFGIYGAGFLWLFVAPILTGVLIGVRRGITLLLATAFGLLLIRWFIGEHAAFSAQFGSEPLLLFSIMSGNAVLLVAILLTSSSIMVSSLSKMIKQLNGKIKALSDTEDATIETFAKLAECRDADTGYHIERTKAYVTVLANVLKHKPKFKKILTDRYIEELRKSAPLHDIGKIGIPDNILLKKGPLTPEEMEIMKLHTVYGRDALLRSVKKLGRDNFLRMAAEIAYTHQERWDGSGYPQGLKGEEIPLSGRIMAIADVYDALRSKRSYKASMSHEESIAYLKEMGGVLFDPDIMAFLPEFEKKFAQVYQETEQKERQCSQTSK